MAVTNLFEFFSDRVPSPAVPLVNLQSRGVTTTKIVSLDDRLVRRLFHSHGTVVSIVMERSSQQSWNDRPNSFPCRLITKDVFVEKIVIVIAIPSEHNGNAFLLLLRDELCAVNVSVVAAKQQKQQKCKKRAEKSLSSSPKSPIMMRSQPLFQNVCHLGVKSIR